MCPSNYILHFEIIKRKSISKFFKDIFSSLFDNTALIVCFVGKAAVADARSGHYHL